MEKQMNVSAERRQAVMAALRRAARSADDPFEIRERRIYHHVVPLLRRLTTVELTALMAIYGLELQTEHRTREEIIEREVTPYLRSLDDMQIDNIISTAREVVVFGDVIAAKKIA